MFLVAALAAPAASADTRMEAKRHFRAAMSLIEAGEIERGIAEFKQAYAIKPHPVVLYDIAKAYLDLGSVPEAIDYFRQYVATEPADKERVLSVIRRLEATIASAAAARAPAAPQPAPAPGSRTAKAAKPSEEDMFEPQTISAQSRATAREIAAELSQAQQGGEDMFEAQTITAGSSPARESTEPAKAH